MQHNISNEIHHTTTLFTLPPLAPIVELPIPGSMKEAASYLEQVEECVRTLMACGAKVRTRQGPGVYECAAVWRIGSNPTDTTDATPGLHLRISNGDRVASLVHLPTLCIQELRLSGHLVEELNSKENWRLLTEVFQKGFAAAKAIVQDKPDAVEF